MLTHSMAQRIDHWPTQVAQIAASIAEFRFSNPILVYTNDEVIAGQGRLLAARKLQLHEVPVIVLDHLSATSNQPLTEDLRERCRLTVGALHAVCAARSTRHDRGYQEIHRSPIPSNVPRPNFHGRKF